DGGPIEEAFHRRILDYVQDDGTVLTHPGCYNEGETARVWKKEEYIYHVWGATKILFALAEDYRRTGNEQSKAIARKVMLRLKRLAVYPSPDICYFTAGMGPVNQDGTPLPNGWNRQPAPLVESLVNYYLAAGDKDALDFAKAYAEGIMTGAQPKGLRFEANGDFGNGHGHATMHALWGIAHLGVVTGESRYIEFVRRAWNYYLSMGTGTGWFPAVKGHPTDETCCLSDMMSNAALIARGGYPEFFDYVERYLRNIISNRQFILTPAFEANYRKINAGRSDEDIRNGLAILDKFQGAVLSFSGLNEWENDLLGGSYYELAGCCVPEGMRAIYTAWYNVIDRLDDSKLGPAGVYVNLCLNRDSKWGRVVSLFPDAGRLTVKAKVHDGFYLRPPHWAPRSEVHAFVGTKPVPVVWSGSYVRFNEVSPGDELTITYPLIGFTHEVQGIWKVKPDLKVTYRWLGNMVQSVDPPPTKTPLFLGKPRLLPPPPELGAPFRSTNLPQPSRLPDVKARGPLDTVLDMSYHRQLAGPFGSDWSDTNEPGDGRGRWIQALCNLGAYRHIKPETMMAEVARMQSMRNTNGFFGLPNPPEVIQAQSSFDNAWPIHWGIDFTTLFGDPLGIRFAREIADAFYVPRTPFLAPYGNVPGSHWMGEYGHSGVGFGGLVAMARLAMETGDPGYAKYARSLADLFLTIDYSHNHGHCTSTVLLGLVYTYELTGNAKYLQAAIRGAEVLRQNEQASMAFMGGLGSFNYSEGCGISDWFYLNMMLGRATGKAAYFDKAERILWGPFFHHLRPNGGLGNDIVAPSDGLLQTVGYEAAGCCSMWAPNGLVRALSYAMLSDEDGLIVPLYYPFTASTEGPATGRVTLSMHTSYPDTGRIRIVIDQCKSAQPWRLKLRAPAWSRIASLQLDGHDLPAESKDGWVEIRRAWKPGDEISLNIPLNLWLSRPNSDDVLAIPAGSTNMMLKKIRVFRGPMLLGIDKPRNPNLEWGDGGRVTLLLPAREQRIDRFARADAGQGIDPELSYPHAHLKAMAGPRLNTKREIDRMKGVVFVSDMDWASSNAGAGNKVRRDSNYYGKTITMSEVAFPKGVWTHACDGDQPADVVLDISNRKFASFAAMVGLEDQAGPGSVKFQVLVDGKLAADSPVIRLGTMVHPINVNVKGAKQVVLRVTNGGDGNGCDHAAWGFARFIEEGMPDPLGDFAPPSDNTVLAAPSIPPDQRRGVVLTPVAEFPGIRGATPAESENLVISNREAVLFDVVLTHDK
ncbi:MAG: glycoside hydrolase family 127 protein, partial [Candidatus Omnitrophica bacterium]|nr:glycoside hydrolase family 127 protein [Candidatus Omnitrophota bacterium]